MMRAFFLLFAIACLPACRTNVALIDTAWGEEVVHRGRIAHVRSARTPIATTRDGYRFVLDLVLENDTNAAWSVRAAELSVRNLGKPEDTEGMSPRIDLPTDCVLVTVPARDDASVRLPICIDCPSGTTAIALERLPLELVFAHDGQTLLRRRVVAGSYSQVGQAARVVFLATAGLVLLSLL